MGGERSHCAIPAPQAIAELAEQCSLFLTIYKLILFLLHVFVSRIR